MKRIKLVDNKKKYGRLGIALTLTFTKTAQTLDNTAILEHKNSQNVLNKLKTSANKLKTTSNNRYCATLRHPGGSRPS